MSEKTEKTLLEQIKEHATVKNYNFKLDDYLIKLLLEEPFYRTISQYLTKVPDYDSEYIAAVRYNDSTRRYEFLYNPLMMSCLTLKEMLAVIRHEFMHIAFMHLTARKHEGVDRKIWNIAADLSINSHLSNYSRDIDGNTILTNTDLPTSLKVGNEKIPFTPCIPGMKDTIFEKLEPFQTTEYYMLLLNKYVQSNQSNQNGSPLDSHDTLDDHSDFGNISTNDHQKIQPGQTESGKSDKDLDKEIAANKLREAVRKASQEGLARGWGSVPVYIQELILDSLKSKIDPLNVLTSFVRRSQRANKKSTIIKLNKRYSWISNDDWNFSYAGRKVIRHPKLAISIDESGSVSDDMIAKFFGFMEQISTHVEITVIPFDHEVAEERIFIWKKGQKVNAHRVLSGGTNFDAPTNYVNNAGKFDGHIILTDLCAPAPGYSRVQRMWVTTKEYLKNPYFLPSNEMVLSVD